MKRAAITLLLALGMFLPSVFRADAALPQDAWPTTTPEERGIDSAMLADALLAIPQAVPDLHSFLLIRDGRIVVDAYFYPYDGSTPHDLASVTKSVMTTLIGIAVDREQIRLDQPVLSFFPDRTIANVDPLKQRITVEHLVTMTSGLACSGEPNEPQLFEMFAIDDWVQFALDLPMAAAPGTQWEYCSPGMHLLSAILTEVTGTTALDFAHEHLFGPLEITEVIWPADPKGYTTGYGEMYLHPRDVAKLGQLWLDGGAWDGQQIVSSEWVTAAATPQTATRDETLDYGYGWWIQNDSVVGGQFGARGLGGQYIEVFPALDVVAVFTGSGAYDTGQVFDLITPALLDPTQALPANPEGVAELAGAVTTVGAPPPAVSVSLPEMAAAISGTTYAFPDNETGITAVKFAFDDSAEATVTVTFTGDPTASEVPVGLDGRYRFVPGDFDFPTGLRGTWVNAQTFTLEFNRIANNESLMVTFRFEGNSVLLDFTNRTWETTVSAEGTAVQK